MTIDAGDRPKNGRSWRDMKLKTASLGIALIAFASLIAVDIVIFRSMAERDRLESHNASEAIMNSLFASLRDHEDFGSAIESSSELKAMIRGLGVYKSDGSSIYSWGEVPVSYTPPIGAVGDKEAAIRYYRENSIHDSIILLVHPFRVPPPPPPKDRELRAKPATAGEGNPSDNLEADPSSHHSFFFDTLKNAEVVYLEIMQPVFWRARRFREALFPFTVLLIGALVFSMRWLILRNSDYRRRIEQQRNLVVLGTAASTLAHEIKNPLLSIRLQSSILERICPAEAKRELSIINDEVDRLSALSYRINDYLREPRGRPAKINVADAARETSLRLLGRDVVICSLEPSPMAMIDPDRYRSILENLARNALESGGPPSEVAIELTVEDGNIVIDVLDRGPGVPSKDRERVFDPFFTTKSRGTGIGLAISRRFALAASGDIAISDRPGGGASVQVRLPNTSTGEES
jgi:two-component system, NtrC family, sensor histidine kinase HydH